MNSTSQKDGAINTGPESRLIVMIGLWWGRILTRIGIPNHQFDHVGGLTLHCMVAGQGRDIILLPSIVLSGATYRSTMEQLTSAHRVWVLDLPGSGLSQDPDRLLSAADYADVVAQFMRRKGIEKAAVIGHSCSAPVAIALAERHRPLVSQLVICDSIGIDPSRSLQKAVMGRLIDSTVMEPSFAMRGRPDLLWNSLWHGRTFRNQFRQACSANILHTAAQARVPTLIGWGRYDQTTPVAGAEKLSLTIADSEVYICEHGSHGWIVEHSEEFASVLFDFIARTELAIPLSDGEER